MKENLNEKTLGEMQFLLPDLREAVEKLGVVLEELVKLLAAESSKVDVYLPEFVADARSTVRYLVGLLEEKEQESRILTILQRKGS